MSSKEDDIGLFAAGAPLRRGRAWSRAAGHRCRRQGRPMVGEETLLVLQPVIEVVQPRASAAVPAALQSPAPAALALLRAVCAERAAAGGPPGADPTTSTA